MLDRYYVLWGGGIEMKRSNFILVLLPLHISNRNIAFCRNEHY